MKTIRLVGITNYQRLEIYFASTMVDVAYINDFGGGTAEIIQDDPILVDLEKEEDRTWLIDLIDQVLKECNENSAKIEIVDN